MTTATATVLTSFAYWGRSDLAKQIRAARAQGVHVDLLADSGAFTAHTTGKQVTVKQYATWLQLHAPAFNAAMTLDVIGDPAASAKNTRALQDALGDEVYIVPIFHVGSPWEELARWCADHPYVALGGGVAVGKREKAFIQWLIRAHRIAADHGAALHGLGMTRPPYPELLPFYSVDSAYWMSASRSGTVGLFNHKTGTFQRVRSGVHKSVHAPGAPALIRAYGGDPAAVAVPGFGRASVRGAQARPEHDWLEIAGATSWVRYADHLRTRHRTLPAPGPVRGDGPKIYLAANDADEFSKIVRVFADHHQETPA